jgi:hypothetical protein
MRRNAISTGAEFFGVSDVVLRQASCSDLARFRGYSSGQYSEGKRVVGVEAKGGGGLIKYGLV